jgi:hypothetical protein
MVAVVNTPDHLQAWEMVLGQLRAQMSRADFDTWVKSLVPLGFNGSDQVFHVAAANEYARDWVKNRLDASVCQYLTGLYNRPVHLDVSVSNRFYQPQNESQNGIPNRMVTPGAPNEFTNQSKKPASRPTKEETSENEGPNGSKRKVMLARAYGSERARIIQPERGMFETNYLWKEWVPYIGLSGHAVVRGARGLCYWNPITGELRNKIETDMAALAAEAHVSVRTLKTVLKDEMIRRYFIRYTVRRIMTTNGIRTAGIYMQVRMDDPLTPKDQEAISFFEEGEWYDAEFEDETEEWND